MTARNLFLVPLAALVALVAACGAPSHPVPTEVTVARVSALPDGPGDSAWNAALEYPAELLLQDMVEPRALEPTTSSVRVRALTDGRDIAFRLEWNDDSDDNLPGSGRFADACAIQLPAEVAADVPAPQMGEAGRAVEIAYWRATWQATTEGRPDEIRAIYPNATVDHYPFDAASLKQGSDAQRAMARRYSPARAMDNPMEGPRESAVEDLIAEGPGTLTRAETQASRGSGRRTDDGWQVAIARPLPSGLGAGGRSQIAFAIWQGAAQEVGARKMRTGWVPIAIVEETP